MIRILHTADWHLGQNFYGYDRSGEHQVFLHWLTEQLVTLQIDVLLVAGDIFDTPNPSAAAQRLYYQFLREATIACPNLQLIITAGNHDSAARLEAPNPLLEMFKVTVRGRIIRTETGEINYAHYLIPMYNAAHQIEAYCMAVPYLRQGDYPSAATYAEGVSAFYQALHTEALKHRKPLVAMGHLQATGAEISENDRSERTVIGGLECVPPEAFAADIRYTALGHLHRAQRVSKRENVRYAGSPIPKTFAEKNNKQGVYLIELAGEKTTIERLFFQPPVTLISVPPQAQPMEEVLQALAALPVGEADDTSPFLEVKLAMEAPEPSYKYQITKILEDKAVRLVRIKDERPARQESEFQGITYDQIQKLKPFDLAQDLYQQKYGGQEMPAELKDLFNFIVQHLDA
ncbi:MAG: exonuclease SbcCD subunit D C-terminal domain-containing protein [Massilibacteroides sp.]|nr:exonuclease SbcCD subunit D C-terminal domain-containing protein [Massilibacteroides sp.]